MHAFWVKEESLKTKGFHQTKNKLFSVEYLVGLPWGLFITPKIPTRYSKTSQENT
jgi:hypothetical protein